MAMDQKKLKADLQLNQYLTQALSKQLEGSSKKRDGIILLAKGTLLGILKGLLDEPNVQTLLELQMELCQILAEEEIDMEEVFRFLQLLSKAMRNNSTRKILVLVNMELSQAMIDGTQEVIREKLIIVLHLISHGMIDCTGNEDVEALFKLNEALSQAIFEKSEDKKLNLLADSNLLLAEFMAAGYRGTSTEWLMELNRLAALVLVEDVGCPTYLCKAVKLLSQKMKETVDEAFCKDLLQLNFSLSCLLPGAGIANAIFYDQLIGWKMQLSSVMQEMVGESSKTKKTTTEENISSQLAAALAEKAKLKNEIAELIQARDESKEEARKMDAFTAELTREVMQQKEKIDELVKEFGKMHEKLRGPKEEAEATAEVSAGKHSVGEEEKADAEGPAGKQSVGEEKEASAEEPAGKQCVREEEKARAEEPAGKQCVGEEGKADAEGPAGKQSVGDEKEVGVEEPAGNQSIGDEKEAGAKEPAEKQSVEEEKEAGAEGPVGKQCVGEEGKADAEGPAGKQSAGDEKKVGAEEATSSKKADEEFLRRKEHFLKKVYLPAVTRRVLKIDKVANLSLEGPSVSRRRVN